MVRLRHYRWPTLGGPTTATIHSGRDILPAFAVLIGVFNAVTPAYLHQGNQRTAHFARLMNLNNLKIRVLGTFSSSESWNLLHTYLWNHSNIITLCARNMQWDAMLHSSHPLSHRDRGRMTDAKCDTWQGIQFVSPHHSSSSSSI